MGTVSAGVWSFGVSRTRVGSWRQIWSHRGQGWRKRLLGRSPLFWKSCSTLGLLAFHSPPSSTLPDLPLPVLIIVLVLLLSTLVLRPVFIRRVDAVLLVIQEVESLVLGLPLLLLPSLLLLAVLSPRPRSLGAERLRGGGTAVIHRAAGRKGRSCRGGKGFIRGGTNHILRVTCQKAIRFRLPYVLLILNASMITVSSHYMCLQVMFFLYFRKRAYSSQDNLTDYVFGFTVGVGTDFCRVKQSQSKSFSVLMLESLG